MSNTADTLSDEARIDRFLDRFFEEGTTAAVLGGTKAEQEKLTGKLIARLFPTPLIQLNSDQAPSQSELDGILELAVTEGRIVLVHLADSVSASLLRALEKLVKDRSIEISKPQGWVETPCHEDFKLLLSSSHGEAPLLELIPLKLRLTASSTSSGTGGRA